MLPGATTATAGIDNLAKYMATSMTEAADPASDAQWARRPAGRRSRCRGPAHPASVQPSVLGHSSMAITKDVYGHLVEGQKRPPPS